MYLEMLKGKDVILNLNQDEKLMSEKKDILNTKLFKLTELAKLFGSKSVKIYKKGVYIQEDEIFIDYINSSYDNNVTSNSICKKCKLVIRVYWDDCNQSLTLDEIWFEGNKIGFLNYKKDRSAKPNDVLKEETNFFDIRYINYDFTIDSIGFDYEVFENEKCNDVYRRDFTNLSPILISPEQNGYLETLIYNEILDVKKRDIPKATKKVIVKKILKPFLNKLISMSKEYLESEDKNG